MSMPDERAEELLHRHLDGTATAAEVAELRRLIEARPELAAELFASAEEQQELAAVLRALPAPANPAIRAAGVEPAAQRSAEPPPAWRRRRAWLLPVAAAAAAAIVAVVCAAAFRSARKSGPARPDPETAANAPAPAPAPLAVGRLCLTHAEGAVGIWSAAAHAWREIVPGESLVPCAPLRVSLSGHACLSAGGTELALAGGTRVRPAAIEPASGRPLELALERGSLSARLAAGAQPVGIETPLGRVDVASGEVRVSLAGEGRASVESLSGRAAGTLGGKRFDISAGQSFRLGEGAAPSAAGDPEPAPAPAPAKVTATAEAPLVRAARTRPASAGAPALGRLVLRDSAGREAVPLEVRELRVRARVLGPVALTEIEQTFFNPTDRRAEGVFYFPLPAGASISRFAMYVDGRLVEGELVERERARQVYEEIVRRMQDPALMEWQEGNVFKTRIFPIPARGPKRILIAYTQTLPAVDGARRYVYPLAGGPGEPARIGRFEFEAEIAGHDETAPVGSPAYPDARCRTADGAARVALVREGFRPERDLVLRIGALRTPALRVWTDRRLGEDGFFMLSYQPPESGELSRPDRPGRDFVFMVDTSLSRRADDFRAQLMAAETLLGELQPDDRFAVLTFDVAAHVPVEGFVPALPEKRSAALDTLAAVKPLGATDLGRAFEALDGFLAANAPRGRPEVVLIGDGIATIGETAPEKLVAAALPLLEKSRARLHSLAMGSTCERLVLRELARRTGGIFRIISPGDEVAREAFRAALDIDSELLLAPRIVLSGTGTSSVYPEAGDTLVSGEETILLGRYQAAGGLHVAVERPGEEDVTGDFELPETDSRNVFIPRLWARERLEALLLGAQSPEVVKQVVDLSQEFTLITPYTSFLVLEDEAAYGRYGIRRALRRRYWEEMGRQRTAPPPEEIREAPRPPAPDGAVTTIPAPQQAPDARPAPPPFKVGDLELSLLSERLLGGRELATALSALSQEIYYRYLPMYAGASSGGGSQPQAAQPVPEVTVVATDNVDVPDEARTVATPGVARPPEIVRTNEVREDLVGLRRPMDEDAGFARTGEDFLHRFALDNNDRFEAGLHEAGDGGFVYTSGRRRVSARFGGSAASESVIDAAQLWLARRQLPDGRWGAGGEETAMALLAYLGAGYTERDGRFREVVRRAGAWLMAHQRENGHIGAGVHEHALATLALSEDYGMSRNPAIGPAAQKAVDRLVGLQREKDGLRFGWGEDSSCEPLTTAFAVMALKSAKIAGLQVPGYAFEGALRYWDSVTAATGAVGADGKPRGNEAHLLNTAAGMVSRQMMGATSDDARVSGAADILVTHAIGAGDLGADGLFLRYFGTLGLFQVGGERWKKWNDWLRKGVIEAQRRDGEFDGSWDPAGIFRKGRRTTPPTAAETERAFAAALERIAAERDGADGYSSLALALSGASDDGMLVRMEEKAGAADQRAGTLVRLRRAILAAEAGDLAGADARLAGLYEAAGRPDNVLGLRVGLFRKAGQPLRALDLLVAEANAGRTSDWRRRAIATLLFDPAVAAGDPLKFAADRLEGDPARHVELRLTLAALAGDRKLPAVKLAFLEQAYVDSGRDGSLLMPYVEALRENGREAGALETVVADTIAAAPENITRWHVGAIAELLLSEKAAVADVPARIRRDFADRPDLRLAVYRAAAARAEASGRSELAAGLFGLAYAEGGRLERHARDCVRTLLAAGRKREAVEFLVREARDDDRLASWRMKQLAALTLADVADAPAVEAYAAETFRDRPRARAAFKLELARAAEAGRDFKLAARLYEEIYLACDRPEPLVHPYIGSLLGAGLHEKARVELENVVAAGYRTTWAFQSLTAAYRGLDLGPERMLRAVSCEVELLPRDVQPRIDLAQFYESIGEHGAALEQYREAIRIKPGDPYFYRTAVERAVALGRLEVAGEVLAEMSRRWGEQAGIWGQADRDLRDLLGRLGPAAGPERERLEKEVRRYLVKDLVVTVSWDTAGTDVDLHVTEPGGEECSYEKKQTSSGGGLDHDDTDGFGPETYALRRARPGAYRVDVVYFNGAPPTRVTVKVYRNYGGRDEALSTHVVELTRGKERVTAAEITFDPPAGQ